MRDPHEPPTDEPTKPKRVRVPGHEPKTGKRGLAACDRATRKRVAAAAAAARALLPPEASGQFDRARASEAGKKSAAKRAATRDADRARAMAPMEPVLLHTVKPDKKDRRRRGRTRSASDSWK